MPFKATQPACNKGLGLSAAEHIAARPTSAQGIHSAAARSDRRSDPSWHPFGPFSKPCGAGSMPLSPL